MQRGRGGRDDLFGGFGGDPFAGFPGFGGRPGSLISSFFGGRDPFDDPFFTQPFVGMTGPSMFGPSLFESRGSLFGESRGNIFGESSNAGLLESSAPNRPRGPIIREISSDEEAENENEGNKIAEDKKDTSRKHSRPNKEPFVQDPDEEVEEKRRRNMQHRSDTSSTGVIRPQAQTYTFQSSTVTYGGTNGAYYTASTTRRMGGDGVVMEESKEADSTTGRAAHRVSRGIHDKGHTVTRKLNYDGRVDSLQTLHNLDEGELAGFDETWKDKARRHLPGWNQGFDMLPNSTASGTSGRHEPLLRRQALPSTVQPGNSNTNGGQPHRRSNSTGGRGR